MDPKLTNLFILLNKLAEPSRLTLIQLQDYLLNFLSERNLCITRVKKQKDHRTAIKHDYSISKTTKNARFDSTHLWTAVTVFIIIDDSIAPCSKWSKFWGSVQQAQSWALLHPPLELFKAAVRELVRLNPLLSTHGGLHDAPMPIIATTRISISWTFS